MGQKVEELVPMEEGGEHVETAPEGEVHLIHDVERIKRALRKLHTNLGHPGVKEMVRVLKHGSGVGTGNSGGTKNAL